MIAVCHPNAIDKLPSNDPRVVKMVAEPMAVPGSRWDGYKFINSIGCLSGPHTDADVFLTSNLINFRPSVVVQGRGNYAHPEGSEVWTKMAEFCTANGVRHGGVFGCGSSLMGKSELVLDLLRRQLFWSEKLLDHFKEYGPGTWPGWFSGVITMYAAEIAANENYDTYLRHAYHRILDMESMLPYPIDSLVMHIQAVPTDEHFSKSRYRQGAYQGTDLRTLDRTKINHCAHWIAATPLEQIKREVGYPF
ncbi:hypothetical protein [Collimonas sp. OK607]|uniref:DUF7164 domain-containing protein n=1 Tax=Collimonas sp. OK607 TaxID=1798194 RepID=UPI001B8AE419|nr:hypothetical protein [Collimonas sp. OK607]